MKKIKRAKPIFSRKQLLSLANLRDQRIYATGGYGSTGLVSSVYCYEICTDRWVQAPSMREGRANHSSCILGDSIKESSSMLYVCGGRDARGAIMNSIERLNLEQGQSALSWETLNI